MCQALHQPAATSHTVALAIPYWPTNFAQTNWFGPTLELLECCLARAEGCGVAQGSGWTPSTTSRSSFCKKSLYLRGKRPNNCWSWSKLVCQYGIRVLQLICGAGPWSCQAEIQDRSALPCLHILLNSATPGSNQEQ